MQLKINSKLVLEVLFKMMSLEYLHLLDSRTFHFVPLDRIAQPICEVFRVFNFLSDTFQYLYNFIIIGWGGKVEKSNK